MPHDAHERAKVRLVNKLVDEYVHNSCTILTFATAFRPWFAGLTATRSTSALPGRRCKKRTEYKRDVALHGLESKFAREALEHHQKLLKLIDEAGGDWLAGGEFSLADIAAIPYVLRLDLLRMARLWEPRPAVAAWYKRVMARPSVRKEITRADDCRGSRAIQEVAGAARPVAQGGCYAFLTTGGRGMLKTLTGLLLVLVVVTAWSQSYPNRAVRVIVPAGTGGPDIVARVVAAELQTQLGQPFVVENRPGANGIVGTDVVAKSAPDGHTLMVYSPGFVVNKFVHKSLPYDTEKDFVPVTNLVSQRRTVPRAEPLHPGRDAAGIHRLRKEARGEARLQHPGSRQ